MNFRGIFRLGRKEEENEENLIVTGMALTPATGVWAIQSQLKLVSILPKHWPVLAQNICEVTKTEGQALRQRPVGPYVLVVTDIEDRVVQEPVVYSVGTLKELVEKIFELARENAAGKREEPTFEDIIIALAHGSVHVVDIILLVPEGREKDDDH
ncbi:MAG TPA: hypothetical protein VEA59_05250 [Patescibacteria group bacterium]|nr:hypothetical protein [Patescibacteria group bacterium]